MAIASVYFGDDLGRYGFGDGHPFGPDRVHAFWRETVKRGLDKRVDIMAPVACDESALLRFHTPAYIDLVKRASKTGEGYLDAGDTPAFKGVFEAGCYVVGSDLDALQRIVSGESPRVFIPIAGLSKGDEVGTNGTLGKITGVDDNFVTVEVADGVRIKVQRMAIAQMMPKGTVKSEKVS